MRSLLRITRRFSGVHARRLASCAIAASGTATLAYVVANGNFVPFTRFGEGIARSFPIMAQCATKFVPQSSVINGTKNHALYLTIHLKPGTSPGDVLKAIGQVQKHVDSISPPDLRDESDEIWFGVGFGPQFMDQMKPGNKPADVTAFPYRTRVGLLGDMPNTGGDIFIHAKCDERGKLFELCQAVMKNMPSGSVAKFEDVYGWVYRGGRDLTGFIDGTENPADEDDRIAAAIDPKTGGSYVITQRWIHRHDVIQSTRSDIKEQYIGRQLDDSTELKKKTITAHVSRMVGSAELNAPAKFQIVRHSQPYGTLSGDSGLFFIGYSATPGALDWMLDRMTGHGEDKQADDVMRMTQCVTGNYWYFPSQPEFDKMVSGSGGGGSFRLWR